MNKLTLARGFNRIFIVLAVVWAFYCLLVYPLQMRRKLVESDVEQGATCYDSSDHDFVKDCAKMWRDAADKDSKEWSLVGYYKSQWVLILTCGDDFASDSLRCLSVHRLCVPVDL